MLNKNAGKMNLFPLLLMLLVAGVLAWWLFSMPAVQEHAIPTSDEAIERGAYLVQAGGCISCHEGTETAGLSGGMALESEFGIFHASNITPDADTGIGGWNGQDFIRAMKHGRSPEGSFYYPAFPYRSYAGLSDEEVLDIAAWLMTREPVSNAAPSHELPGWLMRPHMAGWNRLADFMEGSYRPVDDAQLARGAYLARYLGHCGECHTPRNSLGISRLSEEFAGGELEGRRVAAMDAEALSSWSEDDFELFLFMGLKPDGDFVGGKMDPVIEHNTSQLTEEDRQAMAAFFIRGQQAGE